MLRTFWKPQPFPLHSPQEQGQQQNVDKNIGVLKQEIEALAQEVERADEVDMRKQAVGLAIEDLKKDWSRITKKLSEKMDALAAVRSTLGSLLADEERLPVIPFRVLSLAGLVHYETENLLQEIVTTTTHARHVQHDVHVASVGGRGPAPAAAEEVREAESENDF